MAEKLNASVRPQTGTRAVKRLRREGRLPAIIYKEGQTGLNLTVAEREFRRLLQGGEQVVTLEIEGKERQALIKDVQYDALGEHLLHVDFNELKAGQKVRVEVPLALKGTAKGVTEGGALAISLHELEVECAPDAIPEKIEVMVDALEIGQTITVGELSLPEGVVTGRKADELVVSVTAPREEEEEPAAEAVEAGAAEPEVLTAKKPEDENKEDGESKD